jgi:diphosphoinositol-polyphosphate diphosphatase
MQPTLASVRCVPYRVKTKGGDEGNPCSSPGGDPAEVEVLMISTPNRADMVFPKVRGRNH